ncbi:hypothetical protein Pcac1_g17853 [Phytophthora cactorum]|uniref:Integrase-like, catalytic domain n=2 Tax=Phytophthora cactorum TaxID=29920 RepID=A0A8T1F672_9STRA|nr:hypothetical protein Pcac1_g17853 [Phytophthora cactorum]KAG2802168.1 hypothetical protein PC112_g19743 [Phytophthora cactorum]KAG2873111.1 hypothetical protein PC114_g26022 [Phytophthora cactorum]KAG2969053.1 hypothetical protein PC118_g17647 [Phytophthora cactorum]
MSFQDLTPVNSQRARQTAINAFGRFVAAEGVSMDFVAASLLGDGSGAVFVKLMDRFGVHLAFAEGRGGKPLARNSVMSYNRHVKNWLLDTYPKHRATIEKKLLKMGQTLERHCLKRVEGGMIKKAPACTKEDLRILMDGLYYDAASPKDYQDAALLALMWYAFGRASDLGFVVKGNLFVRADGVVLVRLIRVKTAEAQGLSLSPDRDSFIPCPLHAIAMDLVMQDSPCAQLLDHPHLVGGSEESVPAPADIPLAEARASCGDDDVQSEPTQKKRKVPEDNMKIHAYVNRVVKSASAVQAKAKPTGNLTSHSFRRGGAQRAISDPLLSAQWIFDRGSWNMMATNKAFAYVFNTTSKDQKIARVLSGWDAIKKPPVPTLSWFDSASQQQALELGNLLFQPSIDTQDPEKKLNGRVAEVLVASLIQHFPEVLERYPMCLYAARMRECLVTLGLSRTQMLPWSSELQAKATRKDLEETEGDEEKLTREKKLINHQNRTIGELIAMNRALTDRVNLLEYAGGVGQTDVSSTLPVNSTQTREVYSESSTKSNTCGSKALPKGPAAIWFEWYAKTPRRWDMCGDRQKKSAYKQTVNCMKRFLPNGFHLDPSTATYCDQDLFVLDKKQKPTCSSFSRSKALSERVGLPS